VSLACVKIKNVPKIRSTWLEDIERHGQNRIVYCSKRFDYPLNMVCEQFSKAYAVNTIILIKPLSVLIDILHTIENYKMFTPEIILRNLRVISYSREFIEKRFNEVESMNMKPRLWMVWASTKTLNKIYARNIAEKEAAGEHNGHLSFFMKELNLDEEAVEGMFTRNEQLCRCRLRRVKKTIDYLLQETTYTAEDIRRSPIILNYATKRIMECTAYAKKIDKSHISLTSMMFLMPRGVK